MSLLYIYDGVKDLYVETDDKIYSYKLKSGKINGSEVISLNDGYRFNQLSLELRDVYTEYIYSLNKLFIKNRLVYDRKLSLFFLSDLSNKRTEVYDTYQSICHINIIQEKITSFKNIDRIILCGCSHRFARAISSVLSTYDIVWEKASKKASKPIKTLFLQLLFFCKTFLEVLFLKFLPTHKYLNKDKIDVFLTRFPLHFERNIRDEKYGELVKPEDYYLISVISDGMHQNLSIVQFIAALRKLSNFNGKAIILDRYVRIRDVLNILLNVLRFQGRYKKLFCKKYIINGIDITEFLRIELASSFLRIPRLILYEFALKFVFSRCNIANFFYYLHEFSYGRYFAYMLKTYGKDIKTIGFQHGPNSRRHIMFYLAKMEPETGNNNYLKHLPLPDEILAENIYSLRVYEEGGYKNIKQMDEIYRLKYLKEVNRNEIKPNTVLVAAALHDGEQLLNHLKVEMIRNKHITYYFKFHPRSGSNCMGKIKKLNAPNVIIADEEIVHYLSFVSDVIATQSSVGYEGYLLGIPVRVVSLPNKINDSPLLDIIEIDKSCNIRADYISP